MMHDFLSNNRSELVARCTAKVAQRDARSFSAEQLKNGIPLFLDQLIRTLRAEDADKPGTSLHISGASGGDALATSEIGVSAAAHGKALLGLGFTVDQVVHNYGDLCQAVTDLAFERDAPFSIDEFRTLNRCLDNAIADAVTEFSLQREHTLAERQSSVMNERLGFLVHELRNALSTAVLAVSALEIGTLPLAGATGAVLKRSHLALGALIEHTLAEVRAHARFDQPRRSMFSVAEFIAQAQAAADLQAGARECTLLVSPVDPALAVDANQELLLAALANLLQNAFKFSHSHSMIRLHAYANDASILIDVSDECGGLPRGDTEILFKPFSQRSGDRIGLGLGLSIARQNVEADGGTLTVRNVPGVGCIFTIRLPRCALA